MDNIMAIAAVGTSMSASQLQKDVSISVLKKAMNAQQSQAAELIQTMTQAVQAPPADPSRQLDILV